MSQPILAYVNFMSTCCRRTENPHGHTTWGGGWATGDSWLDFEQQLPYNSLPAIMLLFIDEVGSHVHVRRGTCKTTATATATTIAAATVTVTCTATAYTTTSFRNWLGNVLAGAMR